MSKIYIPEGYQSPQNIKETEIAIKEVKDYFERALADALSLTRVSAPLFVKPESGLNDNLNGVERPVTFGIKEQNEAMVEIVHSLAKWKRLALRDYGFAKGEGLYTDMTAIRRDEETDNIHSLYVDQWDWEKIIDKSERTEETLKETVFRIYMAIKQTEYYMCGKYHFMDPFLPNEITFITTQELEDLYPDKTPKERENLIAKEKGAVFLSKIGGALKSGERHDGRAPDYDDWELNGDILVYYPVLDISLELSSMGIRVDEESLARQLKISGCEDRASLPFQKEVLEGKLPYTIGGGIGQSRICMFFLQRAHIGEVQSSIWPEEVHAYAKEKGVYIL
ncbi:MAG: aspartate--ammonia ligase [Lachnospiraceae bacterium]|nr:aspartate--ammonia ligase [Lachnospiraceae bacterium]MBQ8263097.1 aspartate--ammonia ligase [Lachnospiraceae bacterium]